MKPGQITFIIVGIVLLVLVATNPTLEDHRQAVMTATQKKLKELESASTISNDNSKQTAYQLGESFLKEIIDRAIQRDNYFLFSLTKSTFDHVDGKVIGFGVLGKVWINNKEEERKFYPTPNASSLSTEANTPSIADRPVVKPNNVAYELGYYIAYSRLNEQVYFHNQPHASTRRNAYIMNGEEVYVQRLSNGFGYVEFTNTNGQTSRGWMNMTDLISKSKLNSNSTSNVPTTNNDNTGYEVGYYFASSSTSTNVYFHNQPAASTRRNAYLLNGEEVYVQRISNGFGYVEFTNTNGQTSKGWLDMQALRTN